mmetsp:Transcript_5217/g.11581  ORF Transcript_5217/g.11581 Transcript_5217/m.11581 type:complete len:224 (+) Transcript_5217:1197-1868(+)
MSTFQKLALVGLTGAACYGAFRFYRKSFSSTASALAARGRALSTSSTVMQQGMRAVDTTTHHAPAVGHAAKSWSSTSALTPQQQQQQQQQQAQVQHMQGQQPSLMQDVAATAAGSVAGHVLGAGISHSLFGGSSSSSAPPMHDNAAPPPPPSTSAMDGSGGEYRAEPSYYSNWGQDFNNPVSGTPMQEPHQQGAAQDSDAWMWSSEAEDHSGDSDGWFDGGDD